MLLFATQRNAPLGNPKPLMRLWDAEGYLPRYTTRRSAALRTSTRRFASPRNSTHLSVSPSNPIVLGYRRVSTAAPQLHATPSDSSRRFAPQLNAPTFPPLRRRDGRKTIQPRVTSWRFAPHRVATQRI